MKKSRFAIVLVAVIIIASMLVGCNGLLNKKYLDDISKFEFWENQGSEAIAQYNIYNIVNDHLSNFSGKTKKVAIIGYDGMRADALGTLRNTGIEGTNTDKYYGHNDNANYSAINHLIDNGGYAYLSYAGGEKGTKTAQHTSTAPGWASILTGVWGNKHNVKDNGDRKNMEYKTFLLEQAEKL